jgi:hypothetical protein
MTIVQPDPEFLSLTENEVRAALDDPDPCNPVAAEIARLVQGYSENFSRLVRKLGRIPADILHVQPRSPIEAVAMRLTTQAIREALEPTEEERAKMKKVVQSIYNLGGKPQDPKARVTPEGKRIRHKSKPH